MSRAGSPTSRWFQLAKIKRRNIDALRSLEAIGADVTIPLVEDEASEKAWPEDDSTCRTVFTDQARPTAAAPGHRDGTIPVDCGSD